MQWATIEAVLRALQAAYDLRGPVFGGPRRDEWRLRLRHEEAERIPREVRGYWERRVVVGPREPGTGDFERTDDWHVERVRAEWRLVRFGQNYSFQMATARGEAAFVERLKFATALMSAAR